VQQNLKFTGILSTGYNLSYSYADNSQQIANIADATYRADRSGGTYGTGKLAGDAVNDKMHRYSYDANGNMLYAGSGTRMSDSTMLENNSRKLLWDEENRLMAISDNGYVSNYWYDAAGERTVKQSGGSEGVFVNGVLSGARTETGRFTAYISPYMVVSNGGNYSKHIYMGSQRIVSKLSNSGIFAASPVTTTQQQSRYTQQTNKIKERFDSLGVTYKGTAQTGGLISSNPASTASSYFYHPDHLGSSSLITDGTGALTQHIQYVPFGEVFVEERTNSWSTPYKFNGKELDEETGLYYYHARYYDPRLSVWLSVDPLAEKFPNISSYVYCSNNPVMRIDPDGKKDYTVQGGDTYNVNDGINQEINVNQEIYNKVVAGNYNNPAGYVTVGGGYNKKTKLQFFDKEYQKLMFEAISYDVSINGGDMGKLEGYIDRLGIDNFLGGLNLKFSDESVQESALSPTAKKKAALVYGPANTAAKLVLWRDHYIAAGYEASNDFEHMAASYLMTRKYSILTSSIVPNLNEVLNIPRDIGSGNIMNALIGRPANNGGSTAFEWRDIGNNLKGAFYNFFRSK
jgi:RHS repeat-associated protein